MCKCYKAVIQQARRRRWWARRVNAGLANIRERGARRGRLGDNVHCRWVNGSGTVRSPLERSGCSSLWFWVLRNGACGEQGGSTQAEQSRAEQSRAEQSRAAQDDAGGPPGTATQRALAAVGRRGPIARRQVSQRRRGAIERGWSASDRGRGTGTGTEASPEGSRRQCRFGKRTSLARSTLAPSVLLCSSAAATTLAQQGPESLFRSPGSAWPHTPCIGLPRLGLARSLAASLALSSLPFHILLGHSGSHRHICQRPGRGGCACAMPGAVCPPELAAHPRSRSPILCPRGCFRLCTPLPCLPFKSLVPANTVVPSFETLPPRRAART